MVIIVKIHKKHKIENAGNGLKRSKMKSFGENPRRRREKMGSMFPNYEKYPPLFFVGSETRGGIFHINRTD